MAEPHTEQACRYCGEQIILRHLGGFGDHWLKAGGTAPYEGRAVCPPRDDDGHSPVEESHDDPISPPASTPEEGRCAVVDEHGFGRCLLDADHAPNWSGVTHHAYENVPGPPGPPQRWQASSPPEVGDRRG